MTVVHPTAIVGQGAELGEGVEIGPYSVLSPHVKIGAGTRLMSHVVVDGHTTIGRNCILFPFASIGTQTQDLKYKGGTTYVEIGDSTTIREYVTVNSGTADGEATKVGSRCHILAYCHVAHGCVLGNEVIMSNLASLAGHVVVEDQAILGGMCGVHQFVRIGRLTMIGGLSKISQDCPPFTMIDGNPAVARGLNSVGLARRNVSTEVQSLLKQAYRILYRQGLSTSQALQKLKVEIPPCPEVDAFVGFVEKSERGIIRSFTERLRRGAGRQEDE